MTPPLSGNACGSTALLPSRRCAAPQRSLRTSDRATVSHRVRMAASKSSYSVDMSLNPRLALVQPSKTMALTDLARRLKEEGKDVIALAAGEPDFDTPEAISAAGIAAIKEGYTRYTPNAGTTELLLAIAEKLEQENGISYDPMTEIVVSNGAKQSVWQGVFATVAEGDEVIIPAPYWVSYPEMARLSGAKPVIVDTTAEEDYLLTPEKLRAVLTPQSRLLILCTPSNPSGMVYTRAQLEALADVIREHPRLLVLSDEIYEYIVYEPAEHHSFASLPGMWERTLTVNGFSKAYAMTGWRLGYIAAPRPFARACAIIQSQSTSGASSVAQRAAMAAFQFGPRGGEEVAAMRDAFRKRRDYVVSRLQAIPGVNLPVPQGAFYALPDLSAFFGPGCTADGFGAVPDCDALCRYILQDSLLALVPGDAFGSNSTVRISYAASLGMIEKAMDRLEAALAKIQRPQ
ncbi:unnamed protein product [Pedinophyceae sp. YPF-701]|nr:unnamed protein product [Pedinophyceae sp. YPF-701]